MDSFAINNIANMERQLYGYNAGRYMNCPSVYNNYLGSYNMMNYYNPMFRGYGNYGQDIFTQYNDATGVNNQIKTAQETTQNGTQVDWNNPKAINPPFQGVTQEDMDKLADYYAKNNALEEGLAGAAMGGLSWMAFEHAQSIFHPKNAWKGIRAAQEMFKDIPKEIAAKNATLLQDAQIAVQQVIRDTGDKGWWSKWIRRPLFIDNPEKIAKMDAAAKAANQANKAEITRELNKMKDAIKEMARTGNVEGVATATERLQAVRGMDGRIMGPLTGGRKTVAERLASKAESIKSKATDLVNMNSSVVSNNFKSLLKSSFKRDFVGFMVFESIFNAGKIMTAFQKDTKTGVEQTCQSLGKSAIGTAGWCVGRAAGALLAAKVGASLGIAGGPLGAGVGALIGFTVGSIGMWAGHKLGNAILGHDVADKIEAQNMAKTQEGQVQLLQFAAEKAKEGKTDAQTNQIVYKALNAYA